MPAKSEVNPDLFDETFLVEPEVVEHSSYLKEGEAKAPAVQRPAELRDVVVET